MNLYGGPRCRGGRGGSTVAIRKTFTLELSGLSETARLLRSPKNAERLLKALEQARRGEGKPMKVAELRRDLGLSRSKIARG
jgi:antitoxin YefM